MESKNIEINLFQEDSPETAFYNLVSLLRGIFELIDQYNRRNNLPGQDGDQLNDRVHILPSPIRDDPDIYTIDIILMGQYDPNPPVGAPEHTPTIIRIPLSDSLYLTQFQILVPDVETLTVPINSRDHVYQGEGIQNKMSARISELYNGLNRLGDSVRGKEYHEYFNNIRATYYGLIFLIPEATRSEVVRTYIAQQNILGLYNQNPQLLTPDKWVRLREAFDWNNRRSGSQESLILIREDAVDLFTSGPKFMYYLIRLRFLKKIRTIIDMDITNTCKELKFFQDREDEDKDEDRYKGFKSMNARLGEFTSLYQKHIGATSTGEKDPKVTPTTAKKAAIEAEVKQVQAEKDQRQQMLEVMIGKRDETDHYKQLIKDNYGVDLNDEDTKQVAEIYRKKLNETFTDKVLYYTKRGFKANLIIRGSIGLAKEVLPKIIEKLLLKFAGKAGGKTLVKKIPFVSIGVGLGLGIMRVFKGDFAGAAGEVVSGAVATIPVVGTAVSGAVDVGLAYRDYNEFQEKIEKITNSYGNTVNNISTSIEEYDKRLLRLVAAGEIEQIRDWKENPKSRFLLSYD